MPGTDAYASLEVDQVFSFSAISQTCCTGCPLLKLLVAWNWFCARAKLNGVWCSG